MRDITSCINANSLNVSNRSCASCSSNPCISPSQIPSIQNAVSCFYRVTLSTQMQLLITVTWSKNQASQGLSINFGNDPSLSFKLNTNSRLFTKKKGSKIIEADSCRIEIFWDLSSAKYLSGPEPDGGFYVLVMVNSEIGLALGEVREEAITKRFKGSSTPVAKVSLTSRREHCSGNTFYATKAQFCDTGIQHDIVINCSGWDNEGLKHLLSVTIDKKLVIRVKRLQWNFRGNQAIFVDGLLVDLFCDLHDWFFSPSHGCAVFMFRTRSGMDSRLWLEEKLLKKEQDRVDFSLLIYASKKPLKLKFR